MEDNNDERYRNKGKAKMEYPENHDHMNMIEEKEEESGSSSDTSGDTVTKCIKRLMKSTRPHHNPYFERGEVSSRCSPPAPIDHKLPPTNMGYNIDICTDMEMLDYIPSTPPQLSPTNFNDSPAPEYVMAEMRRLVRAMATIQIPRRATLRIGDTIRRAPLTKLTQVVSEKVELPAKKRKLILKINTTKSTIRVEERDVDDDHHHAANEPKRPKNFNQDHKDIGPPNP